MESADDEGLSVLKGSSSIAILLAAPNGIAVFCLLLRRGEAEMLADEEERFEAECFAIAVSWTRTRR